MLRCASFVAAAMAVAGTSATVASATPVTVQFSGVVGTPFNDSRGVTDGTVGPGTPFSGSYTLDLATPGRPNVPYLHGPGQGTFYFDDQSSLQLSVGNLDLSSFALTWVTNDQELSDGSGIIDVISFWGIAEVEEAFGGRVDFAIVFHDPTGAVLDSEVLVTPDLDRFEGTLVAFDDTSALLIVGSIDSISIVPEPGTALLVSLGLVVFGARRVGRRPAG